MKILHYLTLFLTAVAIADMSAPSSAPGKALAMRGVPIGELTKSFEGRVRAGGTEQDKMTLALLKVGKESVGLSNVALPYSYQMEYVNGYVVSAITTAINLRPWEKWSLSPAAVSRINSEREMLQNTFGSKTLAWGWFQYQLGEKKQAKELIWALYQEEYEKVMKLKEAVYGLGNTPLGNAEAEYRALEFMCDATEKEKVKSQMQKMKIHVSNLPQSHVET